MKIAALIKAVLVLFIAIVVSFYVAQSAHAQTPTCATPSQVQGVNIQFPGCVGNQCNLTQATCSWTASTDASQYQVTITQVETNTVVQNQTLGSGTTSLTFNVTQNQTYSCSVSGVNACGTVGTAGTFSLFCKVDTLVSTTAPTAPPPAPTVPPTGTISNSIMIGLGTLVLITIGAFLIVL